MAVELTQVQLADPTFPRHTIIVLRSDLNPSMTLILNVRPRFWDTTEEFITGSRNPTTISSSSMAILIIC